METLEYRDTSKSSNNLNKPITKTDRKLVMLNNTRVCNFCQGEHLIYTCPDFLKLPIDNRIVEVKRHRLCMNCLRTGHVQKFCPSSSCRKCQNKHNTLLHEEKSKTVLSSRCIAAQSLLATVKVAITNYKGEIVQGRAVLDCGSQSHLITTSLVNKLKLPKQRANLSIVGINQIEFPIKFKCDLTIEANDNFSRTITCYIVPKISDNLPSRNLDLDSLDIPSDLNLADPFLGKSGRVDLLLGAPLFWEILKNGKYVLKNQLIIQNTEFGWILAGPLNIPIIDNKTYCNLTCDYQLKEQLQNFWEIEDDIRYDHLSIEDTQCETYFKETVTRNEEGRFTVGIPFKESPSKLGDSKKAALNRLYSMERKLNKNLDLQKQYHAFMREYEMLGHMTRVSISNNEKDVYYLPHHGVVKADSLTTKLRVVFDATTASDNGWSLNDIQLTGPSLQQELFSILLRFRQHSIVVTADIAKMFRQILIKEDHRRYQKFFWRFSPDDEIRCYELNTVTYGMACAPYLAIRCLRLIATENKEPFTEASKIIMRDMYVDDLITGAETVDEAILLCNEISGILDSACFHLRKWASNNEEVLKGIKASKNDLINALQDFGDDTVKTLGLQWSPNTDQLSYRINENPHGLISKRTILSHISKIYDPLGLVAPCVIVTKIIIQKLWLHKLAWDDPVPDDLKNKWLQFKIGLNTLNQLTIPRQVIYVPFKGVELHGFSDASQDAFAACIYVRTETCEGKLIVRLCAKAKVAPLKTITIPRLELCGALLLSQLMQKVRDSITYQVESYYWTDSQIVLCWIRSISSNFQTFVANRIGEIQRTTNINNWSYVESRENPADIASRGISPDDLPTEQRWWEGPSWLADIRNNWPISDFDDFNIINLPETKKNPLIFLVTKTDELSLFKRYSDLLRLKRIIALCLRFIHNCKCKVRNDILQTFKTKAILVEELNNAFLRLVRLHQQTCFREEIDYLQGNKNHFFKSRLKSLAPFLDTDGVIRVGGRLRHSQLTMGEKHPILLSGKHELSKLILEYEHIKLYHCGPQLLLSSVRRRVWIVGGRSLARRVVHNCVFCFKANPKQKNPFMADLPASRVTPEFPFSIVGTDYAGPFLLRERRGRGVRRMKCYLCIFVCLTTKALHLEVVMDLTKEAFLSALNRFISRRGKPTHIYSLTTARRLWGHITI